MKCNAIKDAAKNDSRWGGRWEKDRERGHISRRSKRKLAMQVQALFNYRYIKGIYI